jgi:LacI family transcriptional regulator
MSTLTVIGGKAWLRSAGDSRRSRYDRGVKRAGPRGSPLKKPTIRVVAAKAGVAVSTVSRYLNDDSVSPPMKARLSRVIESLGYKPSRTARNLSLGLKGCIGVVVDSIQDPWFTQLLTGMEEELQSRDISLMLLSLELRDTLRPGDRVRVDRRAARRRADHREVPPPGQGARERRVGAQLPIVAVAPDETLTDVAVLRADNIAAGARWAHTRGSRPHASGVCRRPSVSVESRHRLQGLRDELGTRGIRMRKEDVCFCASYDAEEGAAYAEAFLRQRTRPTAVVLGSDALAIGFIRAAQQRGVHVPGDLSVAAFDGIPEGRGRGRADDDGAADARDGTRRLPPSVHRNRRRRRTDRRAVLDDAGRPREHRRPPIPREDIEKLPAIARTGRQLD